jgi:hypothetical protein
MVYMTIEIVYVHWPSNHSFTGAVNARQERVSPDLHCNENRLQTTSQLLAHVVQLGERPSTKQRVEGSNPNLSHLLFTDKRALHRQMLVYNIIYQDSQ